MSRQTAVIRAGPAPPGPDARRMPRPSRHRACSCRQLVPAVSAPLASQRCCQVSPGWSSSQSQQQPQAAGRSRCPAGQPLADLLAGLPGARPARGRRAGTGNEYVLPGNPTAIPTRRDGPGPSAPWSRRTVAEQHVQRLWPVSRRRGRHGPLPCLAGLLGVMGEHPPDHVLLAGRQIQLRRGQLRVPRTNCTSVKRQSEVLGPSGRPPVPQRMQGRRRARALSSPARTSGAPRDRSAAAPGGAPSTTTAAGAPRGQLRHLRLIQPQPHEPSVDAGSRLQLTGALADDGDQLPPRLGSRHRGRQQLRCPCPGRHIEGDERPVPVRGQRGEDLVELAVRNTRGIRSGTRGRYSPVRSCRNGSIGL